MKQTWPHACGHHVGGYLNKNWAVWTVRSAQKKGDLTSLPFGSFSGYPWKFRFALDGFTEAQYITLLLQQRLETIHIGFSTWTQARIQ